MTDWPLELQDTTLPARELVEGPGEVYGGAHGPDDSTKRRLVPTARSEYGRADLEVLMTPRVHLATALVLVTLTAGCEPSKKESKKAPAGAEKPKQEEKAPTVTSGPTAPTGVTRPPEPEKKAEPTPADTLAALLGPLDAVFATCSADWIAKLKPKNLEVGRSPIPVTDGVLTAMDKACGPAGEALDKAQPLLEGKGPAAEALLRHWTLFDDLYSRISTASMNVGAGEKSRKRNAEDIEESQPRLTETLIPALREALKGAEAWAKSGAKELPLADAAPADLKAWKARAVAVADELGEVVRIWTSEAHDPLMKDRYARKRHLKWLEGYWKRRVQAERALASGAPAEVKAAVEGAYAAIDAFLKDTWEPALRPALNADLVDQQKLKEAKKALEKAHAALEKAVGKLAWPK